jgi:hypothetical protein
VAHLEVHAGPDPDDLVVDVTDRVLGLAWSRARLAVGHPDLHFHDYADVRVIPTLGRTPLSAVVDDLKMSA